MARGGDARQLGLGGFGGNVRVQSAAGCRQEIDRRVGAKPRPPFPVDCF